MIGIIGAMAVEIEGLKENMTEKQNKSVGGTVFTSGKLCGKDAVVAVCGEGKVNAAMCTQAMILEYKPDMIINTGVGGGLAPELKVCDVVSATAVLEHDMDMSPIGHPVGYVCGIDGIEMPCDEKIQKLLSDCVKSCGINCLSGIVASGDQFISSDEKKRWLVKTFNASVCEMEGGAIGHVCTRNGVPFGVLRAVSDSGDDEACMSFPVFAELAAKNSIKVMLKFLQTL